MADIGKNTLSGAIAGSDPTEIERLQEEREKRAAARRKKQAF